MAIENIQTRVGEIALIRPDDDTEVAYLRATVGTIGNLRDPAHFLREAFAGNRFGLQTNGATLSLGSDAAGTVYLTLRTEVASIDSPESLDTVLQLFTSALIRWRERLDLEGELPDEASGEEGEVR